MVTTNDGIAEDLTYRDQGGEIGYTYNSEIMKGFSATMSQAQVYQLENLEDGLVKSIRKFSAHPTSQVFLTSSFQLERSQTFKQL